MKKVIVILIIILPAICISCPPPDFPGHHEEIYIARFDDFPGYPYNTDEYSGITYRYVGCGPTTGAMILGYFYNVHGLENLLTPPVPSGADQGLATAKALRSAQYMDTNSDGFGLPGNIEKGIENYVDDRNILYDVDVMFHVSPIYGPDSAHWNETYGPYGESWTNDADFFQTDINDDWYIDPRAFYDWSATKLRAGIPVFLSIDYNHTEGGDHWVPMVGVGIDENDEIVYYYYNTFDEEIHFAPVAYYQTTNGGGDSAIETVRTISLKGTYIEKVVMEGDSAPDGNEITEVSGRMYGILKGFDVNDAGTVVYVAKMGGGREGIFTSDGETIALSGGAAPGGETFGGFYSDAGVRYVSINNNNQIVFFGTLDNGLEGLFTTTETIALEGQIAPNGELYERFDGSDINDNGLITFKAKAGGNYFFTPDSILMTDTTAPGGGVVTLIGTNIVLRNDGTGVYLGTFSDAAVSGQGIFSTNGINYGRGGDPAPGGGFFATGSAQFNYPDANNTGEVAFLGTLDTGEEGIFTSVERVAIIDGPAPGGGTFSDLVGTPGINDDDMVVFAALKSDGKEGIFNSNGGILVSEGDTADRRYTINSVADPVITNTGQVIFYAGVTDGATYYEGLFSVQYGVIPVP
ncbi:MAG: hypothetical protein JXJ04_08620 [Spirochaetales bacterium]|nr:hypothetical protein [Spirochaetales bacterium]